MSNPPWPRRLRARCRRARRRIEETRVRPESEAVVADAVVEPGERQ